MEAADGDSKDPVVERKLVTVLFCDLAGSTALGERLDAETLRTIQRAYFDQMRSSVRAFGGTVEKFIGDAVVTVFGIPQTHEDDAERAVRCAEDMRQAVADLSDRLRPRFGVDLSIRIGINTGEAVTDVSGPRAEALATGDVMNTAARLEQAAAPGEILVGRETEALTRRTVEYGEPRTIAAKGKAEPVVARPVSEVLPRPVRRRLPLVGRGPELAALREYLEQVISGEPHVAVVLGEPGIGKSRLADEFAADIGNLAKVYRGSCIPYGQGGAWLPIIEAIREEAGVLGSESSEAVRRRLQGRLAERHAPEEASMVEAQLSGLIGAAEAGVRSGPELLWALRRYVEGLAALSPVVLVLDDLQWAEQSLLETLHELIETITPVPLLLVCLGRSELRERVGDFLAGERASLLTLGPLSESEVAELVTHASGALDTRWTEDQERHVTRTAEGNPLFLEEIAAMAADEGLTSGVPRSLASLIAARIDLLPREAKNAIQAGAVIGEVFWDGAVSILVDADHGEPALVSVVRTLRIRGLIEEEASDFMGLRQFRFHHAMIREVAYGLASKIDRARMHRETASWLEARSDDRPNLRVPIAHHYEQALALVMETAPLEVPDQVLVETTLRSILRASDWARSNAALPEARRLLRRAVEISAGQKPLRDLSLSRLALTLALTGGIDEAVKLAMEVVAGDPAPEAGALASLALAEAARERIGTGRMPTAEMRKHAGQALQLARASNMPGVEAQALEHLAAADFWSAAYRSSEDGFGRVVSLGVESGDLALAARAAAWQSFGAAFRCDLPAAERSFDMAMQLAASSGSLRALSAANGAGARVRQLQARLEEAIDFGKQRLRLALDAGEPLEAVAACIFSQCDAMHRLGHLEEAWSVLERAREISEEAGGSAFEDHARLERARILSALRRDDEADQELGALQSNPPEEEGTFFFNYWARALLEIRTAQGRDEDVEAIWREYLRRRETLVEPDTGWFAIELNLAYGRFLLARQRATEARAMVKRIGPWVRRSGSELVARQLSAFEAALGGPEAAS